MRARAFPHSTAVVGVGESRYYRHGHSPDPEFVLCLKAILAACDDAGLDAHDLDGFVSYSDDRNHAVRVASALGIRELRWSTMQWGGGGGGGSGAVQQAAAAVAAGFADTVVVYRALAQGEFGRFGQNLVAPGATRELIFPYGVVSPVQRFAPRVMRWFEETGVNPDTQKAVAMASYHHAQNNPRAVMHGKPLTDEKYDNARWISEPFRLYDCCQESDCAAAIIVTTAERAADLQQTPAYIVGAAQGSGYRAEATESMILHNSPDYGSANFTTVARRLYEMSGTRPEDIDVVQSYENFTGGVVMALVEHGFASPDDADKVLTFDNLIAPAGGLPLNTSGGNLAEAYVHGMGQHVEAVRQIRGQSPNQVHDVELSLVAAGPLVVPATTILYGKNDA